MLHEVRRDSLRGVRQVELGLKVFERLDCHVTTVMKRCTIRRMAMTIWLPQAEYGAGAGAELVKA